MNVLVLGGTNFVGRHIVRELLDARHQVALFNRGKTNPDLFPDAEHLVGDRDSDLSALEATVVDRAAAGRSFDACVDVSGYTVRQVERSLEALADNVGRYLFISSVSVYKAPVSPDFTEEAPIEELDDRYVELSPQTYGSLKAECERTVMRRMGSRGLAFRPGLVNGPWDPTDRATYWSMRANQGGELFVPAGPETPFQVVDARDIGRGAVHALAAGLSGSYTMVNDSTTWRDWLEMSRIEGSPEPAYVWADDQAWVETKIAAIEDPRPRGALPMYLPRQHGWNFWRASNDKARAAGIIFRPYAETIADTLAWRQTQDSELRAGLTPEQEQTLVTAWKKR
jgi:2'-hydroxyisoflavone reductase